MPALLRMLALTLTVTACATSHEADRLADQVTDRTGHAPDFSRAPASPPRVPPGVQVADGLSADEAAAIALWNSPALRANLARLQAAEAELAGAKRPANPTLRVLFPFGPAQFSLLATWPLEAFVGMRGRIKAATGNVEVVAQSLVAACLDLTRDTKVEHAGWVLAVERRDVLLQQAEDLGGIAVIASARAAAGDVPQRDADAATADAQIAADDAARADTDAAMARARLVVLMGWRPGADLQATTQDPQSLVTTSTRDDLTALALASRPDLRSAQLSIDVSKARIGIAKSTVVPFSAVASVAGPAASLGPQVALPIFDQNQAGIGRARADLEAATWRYEDLRLQVDNDVEQAYRDLQRATQSLATYRDAIVGARTRETEAATAEYERGERDYAWVLLANARLASARLRAVELAADLRRAHARLERAIGRRLEPEEPTS